MSCVFSFVCVLVIGVNVFSSSSVNVSSSFPHFFFASSFYFSFLPFFFTSPSSFSLLSCFLLVPLPPWFPLEGWKLMEVVQGVRKEAGRSTGPFFFLNIYFFYYSFFNYVIYIILYLYLYCYYYIATRKKRFLFINIKKGRAGMIYPAYFGARDAHTTSHTNQFP